MKPARWSSGGRQGLVVQCIAIGYAVSLAALAATADDETVDVPRTGAPGITETVAEIMARLAPKVAAFHLREAKPEIELRELLTPRQSPPAPAVFQ